MFHRFWTVFGTFLLALFGCDRPSAGNRQPEHTPVPPASKLAEIASEPDEGFGGDLIFQLEDYKLLPDGSQSLRAAGLHKGQEVRFEVMLNPSWKKASIADKIPIETGTLTYRRVSPESDAFLRVLDEIYHTNLKSREMAAETKFTAASLQGDPGNLANGEVKLKLFYETGVDHQYAELYTNIDLAARKLEVREKDEGYRRQVIQALQRK
jgi:hypothetical protein